MVWSCRGALSMRQHHAALKKSRNRLQVPALQSGRQIGDQRSYSLRTQAALLLNSSCAGIFSPFLRLEPLAIDKSVLTAITEAGNQSRLLASSRIEAQSELS